MRNGPYSAPEFWNELDKKMPTYRDHELRRKQNGLKIAL